MWVIKQFAIISSILGDVINRSSELITFEEILYEFTDFSAPGCLLRIKRLTKTFMGLTRKQAVSVESQSLGKRISSNRNLGSKAAECAIPEKKLQNVFEIPFRPFAYVKAHASAKTFFDEIIKDIKTTTFYHTPFQPALTAGVAVISIKAFTVLSSKPSIFRTTHGLCFSRTTGHWVLTEFKCYCRASNPRGQFKRGVQGAIPHSKKVIFNE